MNTSHNFIIKILIAVSFTFIFFAGNIQAQQTPHPVFKVIPLGVYGGSVESNLSSYMLSINDSDNYVCLDAGTLHDGIVKAIEKKSLQCDVAGILRNDIKGYLISHPHLDHVAGLIINSPDDVEKYIYGSPFCLSILQEKYFNWKSWANFGDEGEQPLLKKYHYVPLTGTEVAISNTGMYVKAFELSHSSPYTSTAFLVRYDSSYILYLGDTGADTIESSNRLFTLWQYIGPLIRRHRLKGIFIEVSFPGKQPKDKLFGHLTPSLFFDEMKKLAALAGETSLQEVPVFITHIKPVDNNEPLIKQELEQQNNLQLKLIFPQQGQLTRL